MFKLLKKMKLAKQKEKAIEQAKEWREKHPDVLQRIKEQEDRIAYIKENNIHLGSLTTEELEFLSTSFSEIGEQAMQIVLDRVTQQAKSKAFKES